MRPKYRVLQDVIRAGIADGSLATGGKLPSEHDMARRFGVAYMTVRAAVDDLVADGTLQRMHGKGTFVVGGEKKTALATLALVVPSLASLWNVAGLYYFPSIVQGFCAEATRLGYEPTVIGRAQGAFTSSPDDFTGLSGAACLLVTEEDAASVEALRDLRVPVVAVNGYRGRRAIAAVAADQAGGMGEAVAMLAARGHRRIAFLPGPVGNIGADERRKGFLQAARRLGLSFTVEESEPVDYTDLSGMERTKRILALRRRPTAVVAAGDLIAAGALRAIREEGLSVPGDVSVVGYGDFHIAPHLQPALTTVRLPLAELGEAAAAALHRQIEGGGRQRKVLLKTSLVERDSVAGPGAG